MKQNAFKLIRPRLLVVAGFVFASLATTADAAQEFIIRKYADGEIPNLVKVVAPAGRCAAVGEATGFLAIGHHPPAAPNPATPAPHISLFKLDPEGKPVNAPPVPIALPKPASLSTHPHYPLSLAFHPTFPLLYVWQDVEAPKTDDAAAKVPYQEFDHFLIYDVSGPEPKLLESFCRGIGYGFGAQSGSLLLNADASRLYVPNVFHPTYTKDVSVMGVGWIWIDADGLPAIRPDNVDENAPAPVAARPKLDAAAAATARSAKLAETQKVKAAGKIPLPQMVTTAPTGQFSTIVPAGVGFYSAKDDVVVFGAYIGICCWDEAHRQGRVVLHWMIPSVPYHYHVGGHPDIPSIFVSLVPYNVLYRFAQADGYPTLLPQTVSLEATIRTAPLAMARRKQVVVGCTDKIIVIDLDEKGRLTSKALQTIVPNQMVEAITFSEKFDRLYIAVDKGP